MSADPFADLPQPVWDRVESPRRVGVLERWRDRRLARRYRRGPGARPSPEARARLRAAVADLGEVESERKAELGAAWPAAAPVRGISYRPWPRAEARADPFTHTDMLELHLRLSLDGKDGGS